jgi:hypothetical protein
MITEKEKFEDTKLIIKSRKPKKDKHHTGQSRKPKKGKQHKGQKPKTKERQT